MQIHYPRVLFKTVIPERTILWSEFNVWEAPKLVNYNMSRAWRNPTKVILIIESVRDESGLAFFELNNFLIGRVKFKYQARGHSHTKLIEFWGFLSIPPSRWKFARLVYVVKLNLVNHPPPLLVDVVCDWPLKLSKNEFFSMNSTKIRRFFALIKTYRVPDRNLNFGSNHYSELG